MKPTARISVQDLAFEVIRSTSREKPADAALREVLKRMRDLPPFDAREVSQLVFAHYRWHGWTTNERNLNAKLRLARQLDERFRLNPETLPWAELRAKAVPSWANEELEVTDEWARQLQTHPALWLRVRASRADAVAQELRGLMDGELPNAFLYGGEQDLFRTEAFHQGEFEIQDIGSQAVGWLCEPKPGETWWDACAGEGGKLLHLSDLMENKGLIWASDRAQWRLDKLKRRAARAKAFNYRLALWDGGPKLPTKTKFDGVLVDAPCSGLGTWQRNPHARWTTTPKDVQELAEVQKRLLTHAAASVKPGGKLVYSVCTLTRKETEEVANYFSETQTTFERQPLPGAESKSRVLANAARLLKGRMFVAVWRRKTSSSE